MPKAPRPPNIVHLRNGDRVFYADAAAVFKEAYRNPEEDSWKIRIEITGDDGNARSLVQVDVDDPLLTIPRLATASPLISSPAPSRKP